MLLKYMRSQDISCLNLGNAILCSNSRRRSNNGRMSVHANRTVYPNLKPATCTNTYHSLRTTLCHRRTAKLAQPLVARERSVEALDPSRTTLADRPFVPRFTNPRTTTDCFCALVGPWGWVVYHHVPRHSIGCMHTWPSSHVFRHTLVVGGVVGWFGTPSIATSASLGLVAWSKLGTNRTTVDVATIACPTTNQT